MLGLTTKITCSLVLLSSYAAAAPYPHANQGPKKMMAATGKAIYFITNEAENAIVALPIGKNGMVSKGSTTKTGGKGSISINGAKMMPADTDALVSQSALTVAGSHIFAVNAGSNTITMFAINPADATCLTMVGQPVAVPGEFPNTVAASMKNKLVCVGTSGAKAGISCASFSGQTGIGAMDALRPFALNQTTPPVGPTNTVSHTFFSSDETRLFTTVKGDPPANKTGFLSVFPIQQAMGGMSKLSMTETRSSPNGTLVLFGSAPIANRPNSIFVTDASFGAAVLSVDNMSKATVAGKQAIQGQAATCWSTISPLTNTAFVTDVAVNRVVEMSIDDAKIVSTLDLSANGDMGLIDLRAAGGFVYALAPGNGSMPAAVTVLDVSGGKGTMKQAQHFKLSGIAGNTAMGMAVLL